MEQSTKKIGLLSWLVLLPGAVGMLLIARLVNSMTGMAGAVLLGIGTAVALIAYFQMSLLEREYFEKLEMDELAKSRGSESLFAGAGADTFPARRSREVFEKYFIPSLSAVLFLLQAGAAVWIWLKIPTAGAIIPERATLAMSLLGLLGLVLFLLGKYSTGLARVKTHALLRPGAAYLLLGAYVSFAVTAVIAIAWGGFAPADRIGARIFCVVIGLIAVESLLALILEIYRVRVRGVESRVLYESRLVGLMGQPEAIFTTAKQTIDYQFGFKVSEHWLYQFMERSLGWLLLGQAVILALSTCVFVVHSGDHALLERFGKPVGGDGVVGPGLHFKLPWPIDKSIDYHTEQIQTFTVGATPDARKTIVWKVAHSKEENFLVASHANSLTVSNETTGVKSPPVNLLSVSIPVQYRITNLSEWAYINKDPESLLQGVAVRQVVQYLTSADFDEVMSRGRAAAETALQHNIQGAADSLQLGAEIIFVGLEDIHPPQKVAEDFEKVVGASQAREAKVLDAEAYVLSNSASASAQASNRIWVAEASRHRDTAVSQARATLFTNQALAYAAAPGDDGIYEQRIKLDSWVKNSAKARKYVIATTNTPDVLIFNLEDSLRPDLIDDLRAPSKK